MDRLKYPPAVRLSSKARHGMPVDVVAHPGPQLVSHTWSWTALQVVHNTHASKHTEWRTVWA